MTRPALQPCPTGGIAAGGEAAAMADFFRGLVDNLFDLIIRFDAGSRRIFVSEAVREMLGYAPEEVLAIEAWQLIHPDDLPMAEAAFRKIGPAHPSTRIVMRTRHKDGTYIWTENRYRHLPLDDGVMVVVRDITASKRAEELLAAANDKLAAANLALQAQAHQDGLTGLANRRRFDELLEQEYRRARRHLTPLGLVLIDVDCFKAYNDRYGHVAGDSCLRRICSAMTSVLHRPGDQATRYGGEEFAVLLPATDADGTALVAERIREAVVALAIEHRDHHCGRITISAGAAARIPVESDDDPAALVLAADQALYAAKTAGRNQVCRADGGRLSDNRRIPPVPSRK